MEIALILITLFSGAALLLWSRAGRNGARLIAMPTDKRWKKVVWGAAIFGWIVAAIYFNYRFFSSLLTKH